MGIKSLAELQQIRKQYENQTALRHTGGEHEAHVTEILVGMATCGIAAGARETMMQLTASLQENNLTQVHVIPVGCMGCCNYEPLVQVNVSGAPPVTYGNVDKKRAAEIVKSHLVEGKPLQQYSVDVQFKRI